MRPLKTYFAFLSWAFDRAYTQKKPFFRIIPLFLTYTGAPSPSCSSNNIIIIALRPANASPSRVLLGFLYRTRLWALSDGDASRSSVCGYGWLLGGVSCVCVGVMCDDATCRLCVNADNT